MNITFRKFYSLITAFSFIFTLLLGVSYLYTDRLDILLFTLLSFFVNLILFCFTDIKYYIIHLFFYITIFIFLVSRPTIDYLRSYSFNTYQKDAYVFAFVIVMISLLGLFIGGIISKALLKIKNKKSLDVDSNDKLKSSIWLKNIRIVSLTVYILTYPFYALRLIERLIFKLNTSYYIYYASFKSNLPYFTYILSVFTVYSMCVYLASKPNKRNATIVLVSNLFANAIYLFIGTRNPFILSLIFSFIYYFIRGQEDIKNKWIGVKEKILIFTSLPIIIVGMGLLNYVRDNVKVSNFKIFDIFIDFIYKQGTSFGVLAKGFLYNSNIAVRSFTNFTFGPIVEYFTHGNFGKLLFDIKPFTATTNSIELAIKSNSYAHNLSYIAMKGDYLQGHGLGSSFIMENFTDYGYLGVFLFSVALGFLFIRMLNVSYRNKILPFVCTLIILNNLFFMPRSSFSESFSILLTFQFWFIIILIFVVAKLISKENSYTIFKIKEI
ncbi:O-antigen polysaccharide polymerase Wzy family protein [uncultured Parvimonas sp.]|uniref:O-antigen polysaccharide polymerase Wzy family protein n=1 Tax=uncultured Parvimonas sp. TaxID=747372 RepID=UPI0028D375C9|nr:O-antigen polysaccharide polymerase Wzy family protein [uncultured Parvimonas sp.]